MENLFRLEDIDRTWEKIKDIFETELEGGISVFWKILQYFPPTWKHVQHITFWRRYSNREDNIHCKKKPISPFLATKIFILFFVLYLALGQIFDFYFSMLYDFSFIFFFVSYPSRIMKTIKKDEMKSLNWK